MYTLILCTMHLLGRATFLLEVLIRLEGHLNCYSWLKNRAQTFICGY